MSANLRMFDSDVFRLGDVIHGERIKKGYKSVSQFSEAIETETGLPISKDTLKRIESCTQEPKVTQYMAICICLGLPFDSMLEECLSSSMKKKYLFAPTGNIDTGEIVSLSRNESAKAYWEYALSKRLLNADKTFHEYDEQDKPHL